MVALKLLSVSDLHFLGKDPHVLVCVHMCACVCVCVDTCMYACVYMCVRVCMRARVRKSHYVYVRALKRACSWACNVFELCERA